MGDTMANRHDHGSRAGTDSTTNIVDRTECTTRSFPHAETGTRVRLMGNSGRYSTRRAKATAERRRRKLLVPILPADQLLEA